ncbi:peptide/nickel transport system permease protein [Panacagrimonas perspica]|uniref:Peptide/nickel transport system permease protein n=1 Tax=Panacagrimonas perspica TaxID=381431 RepID=A0A4R7PCB6_9GAMM|nr:ABC transporter permease [Panacagrimonas perspica]TDU31713.1 peptide/nickel transport system permease protein [Panacagrimonas perspica]THD03072.1 peptide ABC transporter permease [Panacagrimonas perspica]
MSSASVRRATVGLGKALREWQVRLGLATTVVVLLFALVGPWLTPQDPQALLGGIYGAPQRDALLGYDYIGHDVVSRVLAGGASLVWMSLATAGIALVVGTALGLVAGYSRRVLDPVIVWWADVLLAFPNLILVLLVVSMLGREPWLIVLVASVAFIPGVVRLVRGLTVGLASREFVEAAEMLGFARWRILVGEILPNLLTPLLVHLGTMLSWAVGILSGLSYLGYGIAPPAADWGLMVNENSMGLQIQPWAVLVPVLLIALLALGTNLLAEGVGRLAARIEDR